MKSKGLLIDITKCIGCKACEEACQAQNNLPASEGDDLSDKKYTIVHDYNGVYVRKMCRHCVNPACVSVCPVGALYKTKEGAVLYEASKCIGCRYCMVACPFRIPRYEWEAAVSPRVRKCILCYELIRNGEQTACAEICPTGATQFGEREELIRYAHGAIKKEPKKYINYVYGEKEVGGTSVLYLSSIPFHKLGIDYGFRSDVPHSPLPESTWKVLSEIPYEVGILSVLLVGIWWITSRRDEVRKAEGKKE